ncbi:MAG: XdhC family protein [Maribacter sp.]|nr:XdhC family protein [Maribacter sp.]
MKEIKSIVNFFKSNTSLNERAAIAQVVRVEESSYRREGARMVVFESGIYEGGISGGCLEGDALRRSQMAILKQKPSIVTYDTSKDKEIGVGLGCNGIIDVLIVPIDTELSAIRLLEKCTAKRQMHIIATITAINNEVDEMWLGKSFYYDTESQILENCGHAGMQAFIKDKIKEVIKKKRSDTYRFVCPETEALIFIEFMPAQYHLAIFGDNYDIYPMIDLAKVLDWDVSLVGNIQKLKKDKIKSVANLYPKDLKERPLIDERTAVILMAHDYKTDFANLVALVKSPTLYIGCLGPRKRFNKMLQEYKANGSLLSKEEQNRIYSPCGLQIGANTPEEIATSIIGEILSALSGNSGGMLRDKTGPIHERA